jgi:TM2 domain-containing membrane protein YozV
MSEENKTVAEVKAANEVKDVQVSSKSRSIALALCMFFGWAGAHRFYANQTKMGLIMLFTMGGFGMIWFYDFVMLLIGKFKDNSSSVIAEWKLA